jgi:hypothetical protein
VSIAGAVVAAVSMAGAGVAVSTVLTGASTDGSTVRVRAQTTSPATSSAPIARIASMPRGEVS